MKKILSMVIIWVMTISTVSVYSLNMTYSGLSEIGELPDENPKVEIGYYIEHNGRTIFRDNMLNKDEIEYLRSVFSDENLLCTNSDITEFVQDYEYFDEKWSFCYVYDSEDYLFTFDSETVLVTFTNGNEGTTRQGFFKFKSSDIFDELIQFITGKDINQEEESFSDEFTTMENIVNISNFEILYSASFKHPQTPTMKIGVCSFKREGQSQKTVLPYVERYDVKEKTAFFLGNVVSDNTFKVDTIRMIKLLKTTGEAFEYDYTRSDVYRLTHEIQINVGGDMQSENIVVNNKFKESGETFEYSVDMSTCTQTGKLPSDMFSAEYNVEYQEELETTATPAPSATATPSATPVPTAEPKQATTPKPGETPVPTEEPKATEEPKSTSTPLPDENDKEEQKNEDEEATSLDYDFIDVPKGHWAYDVVHEFAEKEIVLGYGNGYFGVDDPITYEHFALLLERLFEYDAENKERKPSIREDVIVSVVEALGLDVSDSDTDIINEKFSDCESLETENLKYIAKAAETGLIIGSDGELFPKDELTRAETVTLLSRAVKMFEE